MPKILIREYDNSTKGIPTTNNFAVVVPGYFGTTTTAKYPKTDIEVGHKVYELKSQKDFSNYVGTRSGVIADEEAPRLESLNIDKAVGNIGRYFGTITPDDFIGYGVDDNKTYIYSATEISLESGEAENGKLRITLKDDSNIKRTYILEKIETSSDIHWTVDPDTNNAISATQYTTADGDEINLHYCKIKEGNEGREASTDGHIGNQIAYELLGLGYTVLFKELDEGKSAAEQLREASFWAPLRDKSIFNFRYILTGGCYDSEVMNRISEVASFRNDLSLDIADTFDGQESGRGDCIALCDIDESAIQSTDTPSDIAVKLGAAAKLIDKATTYSAFSAPRVVYNMADSRVEAFGGNKTFPASFHYLACAARAFERYAEWYAVAGYNRGISNLDVASATLKLGEITINTLAPRIPNNYTNRAINLILHERGNYYLWGNRTAEKIDADKGLKFQHFLNIRQLCCSIKKQLYTACRQFTFDPNSDLLWLNFVNAIKPTLEAMRADQGIKGYTITKVANKEKALLTAKIRIVPIEAVEDFDISIYLEETLTGIIVNTDEEQA